MRLNGLRTAVQPFQKLALPLLGGRFFYRKGFDFHYFGKLLYQAQFVGCLGFRMICCMIFVGLL